MRLLFCTQFTNLNLDPPPNPPTLPTHPQLPQKSYQDYQAFNDPKASLFARMSVLAYAAISTLHTKVCDHRA